MSRALGVIVRGDGADPRLSLVTSQVKAARCVPATGEQERSRDRLLRGEAGTQDAWLGTCVSSPASKGQQLTPPHNYRRYRALQVLATRSSLVQPRFLLRHRRVQTHLHPYVPLPPLSLLLTNLLTPVTALSPPSFLPASVLTPLLSSLNASRDFYRFARAMRRAFRDEIRVEKMGLGAGGEGERERERERLRGERK